jgi:hypothetical protein
MPSGQQRVDYLVAPPLSLNPRHVPVTDLSVTDLSLRQIVG